MHAELRHRERFGWLGSQLERYLAKLETDMESAEDGRVPYLDSAFTAAAACMFHVHVCVVTSREDGTPALYRESCLSLGVTFHHSRFRRRTGIRGIHF